MSNQECKHLLQPSPPFEFRSVTIREDCVGICEEAPDPLCAAALLNQLSVWTDSVKANTLSGSTKSDYWLVRTQREIKAAMLDLYGLKKIGINLQWLADSGFVRRQTNPASPWDRQYRYLLDTDLIKRRIDQWLEHIDRT